MSRLNGEQTCTADASITGTCHVSSFNHASKLKLPTGKGNLPDPVQTLKASSPPRGFVPKFFIFHSLQRSLSMAYFSPNQHHQMIFPFFQFLYTIYSRFLIHFISYSFDLRRRYIFSKWPCDTHPRQPFQTSSRYGWRNPTPSVSSAQ